MLLNSNQESQGSGKFKFNYTFEKWEEKRNETAPYVRFSAVQMYLPMALLKRIKIHNSVICFDLLVDKEKRVLALRFHETGKHVLKTEPAQIGVTQFVKAYKPVLSQKIPLKKIDDGKYENTWAGHLDNNEMEAAVEACGKPYPSCCGCTLLGQKECPKTPKEKKKK